METINPKGKYWLNQIQKKKLIPTARSYATLLKNVKNGKLKAVVMDHDSKYQIRYIILGKDIIDFIKNVKKVKK